MAITLNGESGITTPAGIVLGAGSSSVSPLSFTSGANLTTATAGAMEYDGKVQYFTPAGSQRGVIPGMQYYRLDSGFAGANAPGAQLLFGVGCTLSSNTVYYFESTFTLSKSAGTTSHTISLSFGGTATVNNIGYLTSNQAGTAQTDVPYAGTLFNAWQVTASSVAVTTAVVTAAQTRWFTMRGTVSINSGGTFVPQYSLSAAPGGAYTTTQGSCFLIYPIGTAGSNVSVGTWA